MIVVQWSDWIHVRRERKQIWEKKKEKKKTERERERKTNITQLAN